MKLLSSKVIKNCKVCIGKPFVVEIPEEELCVNEKKYIKESRIKELDKGYISTPFIIEGEKGYAVNKFRTKEIIENAQRQADLIIKEAKSEYQRVIDDSRIEKEKCSKAIEEARKKGYSEGYNEGFDIGRSEAAEKFEKINAELDLIKKQAREDYRQMLAEAEPDAVGVILDIAEKVLQHEITYNKDIILGLTKEAFDKCSEKKELILRVSPDDYEYLIENSKSFDMLFGEAVDFDIRKDPSLKAGGCIIDSPQGSINTSIEMKLDKIKKVFNDIQEVL
ncbi:MAG TPA: FliH/SctL family protein [Clostridiales bacterium]|nr:FliH/SctL family protein [Clostridiales bacterium]